MNRWIRKSLAPALAAVLLSGVLLPAWAAQVERITKEKLLTILDHSDTVVLDVRAGRDWNASEFKIKGAHRADPGKFTAWSAQHPKSATLVLYCA